MFSDLTVRENLELGSYASGDYDWARVIGYFPKLATLMERKAGYLSGGERQMLMIGRAILGSPKLLLVDEPTEGLAPSIVAQLKDVFRQLSRNCRAGDRRAEPAAGVRARRPVYALNEGRIMAELTGRDQIRPETMRAVPVIDGNAMINVLKWWWSLLLVFGLLALGGVFLPLPFANEIVIFSIYAMGCNFLLGRVGFISFGQPAYLAVGAYATAFYLFYFGTNPYVGILIGVAAGIVAALAVGPLFVRLRSDYFALVNLALAVIIYYLMQKVLAGITHGDNGLWFLTQIDSTPILDLTRPGQFFVFALLVCFAVWALYKYLDDSIYGACCLAAKINEDKLRFLGYSNFRIRLLAFVIANTTTALAGALYAVYLGFVSPEITSPARAADPIIVVILGGVGTLYGPIAGAIAYTGMKDIISKVIGNWELLIGSLLVVIMLAGERGILGTLRVAVEDRDAAPADPRAAGRERDPMIDAHLLDIRA